MEFQVDNTARDIATYRNRWTDDVNVTQRVKNAVIIIIIIIIIIA
jgi:hypothetical protein